MEMVYTDGNDNRFIKLCSELDNYLNMLVGNKNQEKYDKYNKLEQIHDVVLVMKNGEAIACGSFKEYGLKTAEVKRVFVRESYRGCGIGTKVLNALEKMAKSKGYNRLILETGKNLKPAIKRYTAMGYKIIDNYGQYEHIKSSICMQKII